MSVENSNVDDAREHWDNLYRAASPETLPWDENQPNADLVALVRSGQVEKGPVLDICSGTGHNAVYLARQGFTCYGIDISPTAVEYARKKAQKAAVSCRLSQGDAARLLYPDRFFTLVFDRGCFHSLPVSSREPFIRGIHRILKSQGKYFLICFSRKDHPDTGLPHSFTPEDIESCFSSLFLIRNISEQAFHSRGTTRILLTVLMEKLS